MSPAPGARLGPYEVLALLGKGGMGEVWRARDTRLDRDVALKALPAGLAASPGQMARFTREAKVLASLSHPGIAAIHAVEEIGGQRFLSMELVEGEDLSARLARGPIPVGEAIAIAREISEALEAAHEKGIVHRDLKPANIRISTQGRVKLLDFGLAKAWVDEVAPASDTQTRSAKGTTEGTILGTAAYMSPEQARGKPVDRRADIWAFGVILYEMLSGRRAFGKRDSTSDILAAVLLQEVDWSPLPGATPAPVRRLLRRCLEKDPRRRLSAIGDARLELDEPDDSAEPDRRLAAGQARPRLSSVWRAVFVTAAALTLGLAAWAWHPRATRFAVRRVEFTVDGLQATAFRSSPLISPDGARLAWVQGHVLRIQSLDDLTIMDVDLAQAAGKEGLDPGLGAFFWSADGAHLAFSMAGQLWRVSAAGGTRSLVCDIPDGGATLGGDWGADDVIVFSAWRGSIYRVPAGGGRPELLLRVNPETEIDFHRPHLLPGGRGLIFERHSRELGHGAIDVLAGGERRVALQEKPFTFDHAAYLPSGHILFDNAEEEGIWAVPFSLSTLRATGKPFIVVPDGTNPSVSADGTLTYVRGAVAPEGELVRVSRQGEVSVAIGPAGRGLAWPALSPDGGRVVASAWNGNQYDLWMYDVERGTRSRMTSTAPSEQFPVWSPSGDRILFVTGEIRVGTLATVPADGEGVATAVGTAKVMSGVFTPDGARVVYATDDGGSIGRLWSAPAGGHPEETGAAQRISDAPVVDGGIRIAPQGDHVAYVAGLGDSGAAVFIRSLPSGGGSWQVSSGQGSTPRWSRNGDRLFYVAGDDLMEVDVRRTPALALGTPRRLFTLGERRLRASAEFDVDAEGRFIMVRDTGQPMRIVVALNGTRLVEDGAKGQGR